MLVRAALRVCVCEFSEAVICEEIIEDRPTPGFEDQVMFLMFPMAQPPSGEDVKYRKYIIIY